MSYTSLALVNNNSSALLDSQTLANISSSVFSIFFNHFVQSPVSTNDGLYIDGSWGLQPLHESLSSTSIIPSRNSPSAEDTAQATISTKVIKLSFNPAAVIISLSILGVLIVTTTFIAAYHRRYLKVLPRDVDTIGSILGFVYSSERLLRSAEISGSILPLKKGAKNREMVKMGWFNGGGKRRWGIEIIDDKENPASELPAVEDVDPARLESVSGSEDSRLFRTSRSQESRSARETIDNNSSAYNNTMAIQTPPLLAVSPPVGGLFIYR